jgi:hypothetical protein
LGVHLGRLEAAEASHALSEAILERLVHRRDIVYHAEGRKNRTGAHLEAVTYGNKGYPPVGDTSNVFVSSRAVVFLAIILPNQFNYAFSAGSSPFLLSFTTIIQTNALH